MSSRGATLARAVQASLASDNSPGEDPERKEISMQRDDASAHRSLGHCRRGALTRRHVLGAGSAALGLAATGQLRTWAAPARQEPVALKFITLGEEWAEHMQEVIDAFEAANPGITVEMETYPFRQ